MTRPRIFLLFLLAGFLLPACVVPSARAESYTELRQAYTQLTQSSDRQRLRSNWERLLQRFDQFVGEHPLDARLDKVFFLQARTWDGLSRASGRTADARQAVDRYLAMTSRFPASNLADDALLNAGRITESLLHDQAAAVGYYRRLVRDLPYGDMVPVARQRLAELDPADNPGSVVRDLATQQNHQQVGDAPRLKKIRFWSGPEYTRVVLDLNAPVVSKPQLLKGDSPRLYFDLLYVKPAAELNDRVSIGNGLIKRVRAAQFDTQRLRVVLDLNRLAEYRVTTLTQPHRLVIDVLGSPARVGLRSASSPRAETNAAADDSIATILDSNAQRQETLHVPQNKQSEGLRLIVVDAGHGGKDPGAVGPSGVYEKDVVLPLALELARTLRQQLGVKVLLTRSDDRFLELRERTAYANRVGADLFISLHANATTGRRAYGVETYFLNLTKNVQAAEVAARENGTTLQEVSNLEAILFDLMANAKINESSRLAAEVQQGLIAGLRPHYSKIKDLGVRQGPFHVLLGATMPSVLIEAAFISHPREEKRLTSSAYRKHAARAIVRGVQQYADTIEQVARR